MISYSFRIDKNLLTQLKEKARPFTISAVLRRLIEKYLAGEVGLD